MCLSPIRSKLRASPFSAPKAETAWGFRPSVTSPARPVAFDAATEAEASARLTVSVAPALCGPLDAFDSGFPSFFSWVIKTPKFKYSVIRLSGLSDFGWFRT